MKMTACHPNVARFIEVLSSRTKICIVLEMVTGGELLDKIVDEYEGRFSEDKARFYFRQLLAGVEYCHARRGHHLNLRPDSLLLDKDGNLKILYFRLSALCSNESDEGLLQNTSGTPNYVAPEVLTGRGYDGQKADLWTCGVILYALLAGFLPFDESSQSRLFKKITAADFSYPPWFSQEVRRLLGQIMTSDVGSRLAILQMKEDPWITLDGMLAWPEVDPHGAAGAAAGADSNEQPSEAQPRETVVESAPVEDNGRGAGAEAAQKEEKSSNFVFEAQQQKDDGALLLDEYAIESLDDFAGLTANDRR